LNNITSGYGNCAISTSAGQTLNTGVENFCLGYNSMKFSTSASYNVVIGVNSGANMSSASQNILIGRYVGGGMGTATDVVSIGYFSNLNGTGSSNVCIGSYSGGNLSTGTGNCFIGVGGLSNGISTGNNNTMLGNGCTSSANNYNNSTCVGYNSKLLFSNGIFLGTASETTYPMGGLYIYNNTLLTLSGSISANNSIITPQQLSFLNQVSNNKITSSTISDINNYQLVSGMSAYQTTAGMSSYQTTAGMSSYLTSAISSNFTVTLNSVTTTITPSQFVFLSKVLVSPSLNAGLIPLTAIANIDTFIKTNTNATITGTYTFSTNPAFTKFSIDDVITRDTKSNTIFGSSAGFGLDVITNNTQNLTVFGASALSNYCTGGNNSAFGCNALANNTSGNSNCGFGGNSLSINLIGSFNSCFGVQAGYHIKGSNNTACGSNSMRDPFNRDLNITNCSALGYNSQIDINMSYVTIIGSECVADSTIHPNNSVILGREGVDDTWISKNLVLQGSIVLRDGLNTTVTKNHLKYISTLSSDAQTQLSTLTQKVNAISYTTTPNITTIGDQLQTLSINTSNNGTCSIGSSTFTTRVNGPLIVSNNAQKVNGYTVLSGTSTLSIPLSEYYVLSTSTTGSVTLPVITSDMYGSVVTFTKVSGINTYTITAGSGNTFRLYKSDSTATTTSITMENNFTVLRIVATQSTIWDVIQTDIFYNASSDWVVGARYLPMGTNPTTISTTVENWSTVIPSILYGLNFVSLTGACNLSLPNLTSAFIPDGIRFKFRRTNTTTSNVTTAVLAVRASNSTQFVVPLTGVIPVAGGSAYTTIMASGAYVAEIVGHKTSLTWYAI